MKIALLSDIHSNIDAFNAVLKFIEQKKIDRIYIAGDLVGYYYYANEVIDLCMSREDIFCIRGNHDRNFLEAISDEVLMEKFTRKYGSSYLRSKEQLTMSQITWLKNLPTKLTTKLNDVTLTLAHGSIHDEDKYVYPDAERQAEGIAKAQANGVLFGAKSKVSNEQVREIRQKRSEGVLIRELMAEYGLSKSSVYRLLN
jgi:predicted phosphodiesterase